MQKELFEKLNKANTLNEIQDYLGKVIEIRGFSDQPVEQRMLLLIEEVGELAKAIRKEKTTMGVDSSNSVDSIESEIADIFIVLVSVCNNLDINIFEALKEKEFKNINRTWTK